MHIETNYSLDNFSKAQFERAQYESDSFSFNEADSIKIDENLCYVFEWTVQNGHFHKKKYLNEQLIHQFWDNSSNE